MYKVAILQNFATIGIPDFDEELGKNWSIAALSDQLIDESRLKGLQHLNTRKLDLVIHNGSKFALLNLQAFKIFESPLATKAVQECLAYYLTSDGNLLFGIQPSGDVIILTEGLQKTKLLRKPTFVKIQSTPTRWYDYLPARIAEFFGASKSNQVSPESPFQRPSSGWWPFQIAPSAAPPSLSPSTSPTNVTSHFPYITALPDGLAVFCAFSPTNYYMFISNYETALRNKSISNFRGSQLRGSWHKIIMHKNFITQWLEEKKCVPWFEAKLCYQDEYDSSSHDLKTVGGAVVHAVQKGYGIELVYGLIKRRGEKVTLSWEKVEYEVDWVLNEPGLDCKLDLRFVARLSSDCKKVALAITTNLGMYTYIQEFPAFSDGPIHISRNSCGLCPHCDYDGAHFYKKGCWISDIQWLVEDVYIGVMSLCGSLSILYAESGKPMILKVRKPGAECDESRSGRFFLPVFHQRRFTSMASTSELSFYYRSTSEQSNKQKESRYPRMKWIDSEKILTCSSGLKIELFAIQRVMNISTEEDSKTISLTKVAGNHNKVATATSSPTQLTDSLAVMHPTQQEDEDQCPQMKKCRLQKVNFQLIEVDQNKNIISKGSKPSILKSRLDDGNIRPVNSPNSYQMAKEQNYKMTKNSDDDDATSIIYKSMADFGLKTGQELDREEDNNVGNDDGAQSDEDSNSESPRRSHIAETHLPSLTRPLNVNFSNHEPSPRRKQSQVYMADDELSDGEVKEIHKSFQMQSHTNNASFRTATEASSAISCTLPLLSRQYETEGTYSPPFSYVQTSAGEDDNIIEEYLNSESHHNMLRSPSPTRRGREISTPLQNQSSIDSLANRRVSTALRLQIPDVPVISAVVIPTSARSSTRPNTQTEGTQVDEDLYKPPSQPLEYRFPMNDDGTRFENEFDQNENSLELKSTESLHSRVTTASSSGHDMDCRGRNEF